ncbi:MAG: hypothetical protein ACOX7K_03225 [Oscillospiraceae bacterium]
MKGKNYDDVPLGLGMALARNMSAMERFSFMNEAQRKQVLEKASAVNSRNEMTQLVDSIAAGNFGEFEG